MSERTVWSIVDDYSAIAVKQKERITELESCLRDILEVKNEVAQAFEVVPVTQAQQVILERLYQTIDRAMS